LAQGLVLLPAALASSPQEPAMALRALTSLVLLSSGVSAVELTAANWDKETAGKSVFIKFLAPW